MRAGIDVAIPSDEQPAMVLDRGREVFDVYTAFLKAHHIERP